MKEQAQLKLKVTIARSTVIMFAFLTACNIWLTLRASNWTLPFSSVISSYSVAVCKGMVDLEGAPKSYIYVAAAFSVLILAFLVFSYFKSANSIKWLKYVLLFVLIDTAAIVFILISSGTAVFYLIEIPMHLLLSYYLFKGIKSAEKLDSSGGGARDDGEIGYYDDECDKIFEVVSEYEDRVVKCALYGGDIVLAVDGVICDSAAFEAKYDYQLEGEYEGVAFSVYYDDDEQLITLFAEGEAFYSESIK